MSRSDWFRDAPRGGRDSRGLLLKMRMEIYLPKNSWKRILEKHDHPTIQLLYSLDSVAAERLAAGAGNRRCSRAINCQWIGKPEEKKRSYRPVRHARRADPRSDLDRFLCRTPDQESNSPLLRSLWRTNISPGRHTSCGRHQQSGPSQWAGKLGSFIASGMAWIMASTAENCSWVVASVSDCDSLFMVTQFESARRFDGESFSKLASRAISAPMAQNRVTVRSRLAAKAPDRGHWYRNRSTLALPPHSKTKASGE